MENSCNHTVDTQKEVGYEDFEGEITSRIEYVEVQTFKDLDMHRYKCTQCNEIFYYSSYGRSLYNAPD